MAEPWYLAEAMAMGLSSDSLWRHYKGNVYKVVGCCLREADGVPHVVYLCDGMAWCRPLREWREEVDDGKGGRVERFTRISCSGE